MQHQHHPVCRISPKKEIRDLEKAQAELLLLQQANADKMQWFDYFIEALIGKVCDANR